jgi:hypothetical protein
MLSELGRNFGLDSLLGVDHFVGRRLYSENNSDNSAIRADWEPCLKG